MSIETKSRAAINALWFAGAIFLVLVIFG